MNPERWQLLDRIFRSVTQAEPSRRAALLEELCAGDRELRREVETLLDAHADADDFLETPAFEAAAPLLDAALSDLRPEQVLGRYRVVRKLGAGGMGEVYLAEDASLGRMVALKLLPALFAMDEDLVRRFRQEARAASALNHPNILVVHDIVEAEGRHFIATEYVEGVTLHERIRATPLRLGEALDIAAQIASALSKAHRGGILHRDIKPDNVMIDAEGHVKVLDFGLAKRFAPSPSTFVGSEESTAPFETRPGMLVGTLSYMSPEQARGQPVDARTDLWSLGVVLYEMLAGRSPFAGETTSDVLANVLLQEPLKLSNFYGEATPELEEVLVKALAKRRDERYQTAEDFLSDLRRLRARTDSAVGAPAVEGGAHATVVESDAHARGEPGLTPSSERLLTPPSEQRKQITVLHLSLSDLWTPLDGWDDEEAAELTRELWRWLDAVVANGGGHNLRRLGEEATALWGTPVAGEDDPERAVRTALAVRLAAGEFVERHFQGSHDGPHGDADAQDFRARTGTRRLTRAGISTGTALLSRDASTGDFSATGAPVSLASRLQKLAPAGCVLISHETYRHVRGLFDVREFDAPPAQEGTEARVYVVERERPRALRGRTRGVEGVETRMIGRATELELLLDELQAVVEDRELRAVTVVGDAGVGKSRLLDEFADHVASSHCEVEVFHGHASASSRRLPFSLVRDLLSERFRVQDSDPPEVARDKLERGVLAVLGTGDGATMRAHLIGYLAGFDFSASPHLRGILSDPQQIRERAFQYAAQFFAAATRDAPAALFLDDIHWADDGSLDLLDHLARTCNSSPLFILCLARPPLLERRPFWGEGQASHTRLDLPPLSKRESRQLVEEILRQARDVPPELRELVVGGAEGNPFYVEELIKMLIEQKAILPGASEWRVDPSRLGEVRVPPTLTGVLQTRLDGLNLWNRTVLQCASVVGRVFWDSAVERAVASPAGQPLDVTRDDTLLALEGLRGKELIYRRDRSSFEGALEFTFKHALLRDVTYESVLKRARQKYHRAAAEWLIGQSDERGGVFAGLIAEHFERAQEPGGAAEWYGRAGEQAREACVTETSVEYYRKALEFNARLGRDEISDDVRRARTLEWCDGLGTALLTQAKFSEAAEAYAKMRAEAEAAGDLLLQARAWNRLACAEERFGNNRASLESARRAEKLAREAGTTTEACAELAAALNWEGWACYRLGDATEATRMGEQALALKPGLAEGARREEAVSLRLLGAASLAEGRFRDAELYMEQALALFRELGDRNQSEGMLNNLGEAARLRGDYDAAVPRYREALAMAREIGNKTEQLVCLNNLAGALVGLADYAAAETHLQQVIAAAGDVGYYALSETYRFLAEAYLGQGKATEASGAAERALALGEATESRDFIGWAWRALGMVAARLGEPVLVAGARAYKAEDCFAESLRVFNAIGMEAEVARTLCEWSRYESEHGDEARAREMRAAAHTIFTRLGIELEVQRMRLIPGAS